MNGSPECCFGQNEAVDWPEFVELLEHRLGLYVGRPTYERAVCLLTGFDLAQPGSIHAELQDRLARRGYTGPISWPSVLLAEALSADVHAPPALGPLTPEEDRAAIAFLCAELRAHLGLTDESRPQSDLDGS